MSQIIDTHVHFWDIDRFHYAWLAPDHRTLYRNFFPSHLAPLMQRAGVGRVVVVQALGELVENDWFLQLAAENRFIAGVVGWIDIAAPDAGKILAKLKARPRFVGVRLGVNKQLIEEDGSLRDDTMTGLDAIATAGLVCDVIVQPMHLPIIATMAAAFPHLTFVLNHLGNPPIRSRQIDEWAERLGAVADFPNVCCKVSGLLTLCDPKNWSPEEVHPYIQVAVEAFGFNRLMYGSDWPVSLIAAPYQDTLEGIQAAAGPMGEEDQSSLFAETARRVYRLE